MWKYVSCCLKETLQRGVNYFDVRCGAGFASTSNQQTCIVPRKENQVQEYQEEPKCSGSHGGRDTNRNNFNWQRCHILHSCINAFTWSGAIVLGWYASQILYLHHKRRVYDCIDVKKKCVGKYVFHNSKAIQSAVLSRIVLNHPVQKGIIPQNVVNTINQSTSEQETKDTSVESSLDKAVEGLANVLSSVENRLALVEIENGNVKHGIEMLQSAAQRNHAPALYNLALCYQKGVGVKKNERMAAELYEAAAALDHPTAMYNLAIFHGQGRGGFKRNPKVAEELLRLAASKGQQDAIKVLPKMSHTQNTDVQTQFVNVTKENNEDKFKSVDKDPYTPMDSFLSSIMRDQQMLPDYRQVNVLSY